MAILSKLERLKFGVDVRITSKLYGMFGKEIYFGEWISRAEPPIIIVKMTKEIADREASFYIELNSHRHIIRTLADVELDSHLIARILVQERAPEGDLYDLLTDNQFRPSQAVLIEIFSQIADAMVYVASKGIVHNDLGCRNVLVFEMNPSEPKKNLVKITDFGLARSTDLSFVDTSAVIPIRYCAPEILRSDDQSNCSEKSDVYSMGALMWEALSNGTMPYATIADDKDVRRRKLNNEKLTRPTRCDLQLWAVIEDCWHSHPRHRLNFQEMKAQLSKIRISEVKEIPLSISSYQ